MTADAERSVETKTVTQRIDDLFAPWNKTDIPGMALGVMMDGKVIYRRGFGMASLETGVANTPVTRMRIGSTSKHFTALLALLLAEDGKFDLDAPIRTYIPELTGPGGEPSARLLLQHRGGSRCFVDVGFLARGMATPPIGEALATQARQTGRNFAPGEAMIYNNGGYHLVSIALERAGAAPFQAQLKARLFDPVGMADTASIPSDLLITPGMATMHVPLSDGGWKRGLFPSEELLGDGAIVSTVDDMLRWTSHLRTRDRLGSPATWEALTELAIFPDGWVGDYALGLMRPYYRGLPTLQHAGSVIGGTSQMLTFPDHGLDVVLLINGAPAADKVKLAYQIADIVLDGQLGDATPTIRADAYTDLLGSWWSSETGMMYGLFERDEALHLTFANAPMATALECTPDGRMIASAGTISEIELSLDEADSGSGLTIRFGGGSAIYQKVSKDTADGATFANATVGRYFSVDGDCVATISRAGDALRIEFATPDGQVAANLIRMGDSVAVTEPADPMVAHWSVLTFDKQGGDMGGFRASTMRTRELAFKRI